MSLVTKLFYIKRYKIIFVWLYLQNNLGICAYMPILVLFVQ